MEKYNNFLGVTLKGGALIWGICCALGTAYLVAYLQSVHVPLPITSSVYGAVGLVGIFYAMAIFFGFVTPAMAHEFKYTNELVQTFQKTSLLEAIALFGLCIVFPVLIVFLGFSYTVALKAPPSLQVVVLIVGLVIAVAASLIYAFSKNPTHLRRGREKLKFVCTFVKFNLFTIFSISLSFVFIYPLILQPIMEHYGSNDIDKQILIFVAYLFVYWVVVFFIAISPLLRARGITHNMAYLNLGASSPKKERNLPLINGAAVAIGLLTLTLATPISPILGRGALHYMGIGGGTDISYCFGTDKLPPELSSLINKDEPAGYCTKTMELLLDTGDFSYLRPKVKDGETPPKLVIAVTKYASGIRLDKGN